MLFFTYFYDYSGVNGENIYSYLDSRNAIADTVNGKFYSYKPVITNGVIASWVFDGGGINDRDINTCFL